MIRSIRPTDLIGFVRFNNRALPSYAHTLDRSPLDSGVRLKPVPFVRDWLSLEESRHTWISLGDGEIHGIISVRSHGGVPVWEVDSLRIIEEAHPDTTAVELLDYVAAVGAEVGVQKVIVRIDQDSGLIPAIRRAGFALVTGETLYAMPPGGAATDPAPFKLRQRHDSDTQPLFRLYSRTTPAEVRRSFAMTMQEWEATHPRLGAFRRSREMVLLEGDEIAGWSRIVKHGGGATVELTVNGDAPARYAPLLHHAVRWANRQDYVLVPVREHQPGLIARVEELGGEPVARYAVTVRQLAARIKAPRLVPVGA